METIHQRIKARRIDLGLSMEKLGAAAGVEWQAVQRWEKGLSAPSRKRQHAVATALEMTVSELMFGHQGHGTRQNSAPYVVNKKITTLQQPVSTEVEEILSLIKQMTDKGHAVLLARARDIAAEYNISKANAAK